MGLKTPPLSFLDWRKSWRIIPSRFPPIDLFERIAPPESWEVLAEIESITNERIRDEIGNISLIPVEDRLSGPEASYIMAPFAHLNPHGSRFSDGTWGVYYAAHDIKTAIEETKFHREKFMKATNEPPMHLDMRVIVAKIKGEFHDIREMPYIGSALYDPQSYSNSQTLARLLKRENSNGLVYMSVRHLKGQNVAVFKPKMISRCVQERHLEYVWDGERIATVFEKKLLT